MTTTKLKNKKKTDPSDSPITVGGGGGKRHKGRKTPSYMELAFDHNVYISDQNDAENHDNPTKVLDTIVITPPPANMPAVNPDSEVVIKYHGSGLNPKVTINKNGGPIGIKFKNGDFPFDYSSGTHKGGGLKSVTIDGDDATPSSNPWTIVVHTKAAPVKSGKTSRKKSRR